MTLRRKKWFVMGKRLLLLTAEECQPCEEAKIEAERIAASQKLPLKEIPVSVEMEVPVTCIVKEEEDKPEYHCFVGYDPETYTEKTRSLLKEMK